MKKRNLLFYLPLILIIIVIPLLVIGKEYDTGLSDKAWYSMNRHSFDFFLFWKSRAIVQTGAIILLLLPYGSYINQKHRTIISTAKKNLSIIICTGIYLLGIVISSILSENTQIAFWGGYEQFEGAYVLTGYLLLFCYSFTIFYHDFSVRIFYTIILTAAGMMALLGVFQFLNMDFFRSLPGTAMIKSLEPALKNIELGFNFGAGRVYLTLYNPNYTGSYTALMLPVVVSGIFFWNRIWGKITASLIAVGLIVSLIGSESVTGYVSILFSFVLFVILNMPVIKNHKKEALILLGSAVFTAALFVIAKPDIAMYAYHKIFQTPENHDTVQKFETSGDKLFVYSQNKRLEIKGNTGTPDSVFEKFVFSEQIYTDAEDQQYKGIHVLAPDGHSWDFIFEEGEYKFLTVYGKHDEVKDISSAGFEKYQHFGSRRGFIWSRTIPLIPKYLWRGAGPDHFMFAFPNNDYVGMENNDYRGQVLTKPHNMYMQIAVQTGFISLLAFLCLYFIYFIRSILLYYRVKNYGSCEFAGLGIFLGTFGYMAAGLANDSTVTVAPIFWVLFGLGIAVNHKVKKQSKNQCENQ